MSRIVYVNGRYVPYHNATVHVEDRGLQFADSIYEAILVRGRKLVDERGHLDRLERSLSEIGISMPVSRKSLAFICRQIVRNNLLGHGYVYIQITRGTAHRSFKIPKEIKPTLIVMAMRADPKVKKAQQHGLNIITVPDLRWKRRDIKTTQLLSQSLAKQTALDAMCDDAWMVDEDGYVTEGTSSNAWIVTEDNRLITRSADHGILKGVTRNSLVSLISQLGLRLELRHFKLEEAYAAREAFISSANTIATPVIRIDGYVIGDGSPGQVTQRLFKAYESYAADAASAIEWKWDEGIDAPA